MAGSKALQLRQGIPPHKIITIRNIKMAVVLLPSDAIRNIEEKVEQYCQTNKARTNENVRNQYYDQLLTYESLREDEELTVKLFESLEESCKTLDTNEISYVCKTYGDLLMATDPNKLELLTQEQLDELKKYLEVTPLSDINTVSLVHLANFLQVMNLKI